MAKSGGGRSGGGSGGSGGPRKSGGSGSSGSGGKKKDVHTVPTKTGWANKVGGVVASNHRTKAKAVEVGRDVAKENESEHVIHKKDGTIGEKNSYGNDPDPPKDEK